MQKAKATLAMALLPLLAMLPLQAVHAAPIKVPEEVRQASAELGSMYNICPELLQAMCFKESSFDPYAENGGCIGVMQIDPEWHGERMERLGVKDLTDTRGNMLVGADYLSELAGRYEDIGIVLMAYNGDSSIWDVMDGTAGISRYASEILALSAELERGNGK